MKCICFYGDCWGFSYQAETSISETANKLRDFHARLRESINEQQKNSRPAMYLFSDSLFLVKELEADTQSNLNSLNALINIISQCNEEAIKLGLPLRGSIDVGDVEMGHNLLVGKAVIEAYRWGERIALPLLVLPYHVLRRAVDKEKIFPRNTIYRGTSPPVFRSFLEVPLKDDGIIKAHLLCHGSVALQQVTEYFTLRLEEQLNVERPDPKVAAALKRTVFFLNEWSKKIELQEK
jgi:hypothetical protein